MLKISDSVRLRSGGRTAEFGAGGLLAAGMVIGSQQVQIYSGLGDKDRTIKALDDLAAQGPVRLGRALTFPEFDLIRGDPRLKAKRKKVGLP